MCEKDVHYYYYYYFIMKLGTLVQFGGPLDISRKGAIGKNSVFFSPRVVLPSGWCYMLCRVGGSKSKDCLIRVLFKPITLCLVTRHIR